MAGRPAVVVEGHVGVHDARPVGGAHEHGGGGGGDGELRCQRYKNGDQGGG